MKKMLTVTNDAYFVARTSVVLVIALALGFGFWTALTPVAKAQQMSATEMIESKLPHGKTMLTATKSELLSAVCGAVKQWPDAARQIVKAGIDAKRPWARDIVQTATRCARGDGKALPCEAIAAILNAAVAADPEDASGITEMVIRLYPDCRNDFKGGPPLPPEGTFINPPIDVNPPPGSVGGGAGEVARCVVCHNDNNPHEITIPCSQVPRVSPASPGRLRRALRGDAEPKSIAVPLISRNAVAVISRSGISVSRRILISGGTGAAALFGRSRR